jgi:hypothetical protein
VWGSDPSPEGSSPDFSPEKSAALRFRALGGQRRCGGVRPSQVGQVEAETSSESGGRQNGEDQGNGEKALHWFDSRTKLFRSIHMRAALRDFKIKLNRSVQIILRLSRRAALLF